MSSTTTKLATQTTSEALKRASGTGRRVARKQFQSGHFTLRRRWQKILLQADLDQPIIDNSDENLIRRAGMEYRMERMEHVEQSELENAKKAFGMKPLNMADRKLNQARNLVDPARVPAPRRFTWATDMKMKWDNYEETMKRKYDFPTVNQDLQQEDRVWKASQLMETAREMTYRRAVSLVNDAVGKQFVPLEKSNKYTLALGALINRYKEIQDGLQEADLEKWEKELEQLNKQKVMKLMDWEDLTKKKEDPEEPEGEEVVAFKDKSMEDLNQELNDMGRPRNAKQVHLRRRIVAEGERRSWEYKSDLIDKEKIRMSSDYEAPEVESVQDQVLRKRQELASEALTRWHQSRIGKLFMLEGHLVHNIKKLQKRWNRTKDENRQLSKLQARLRNVRYQINIKDIRFMGSIYSGFTRIIDHAVAERETLLGKPSPEDLQSEAQLIVDRISELVRLFFEYDARITDVRTALSAYELMRDAEDVNEEVKRRAGELLMYAHHEYEFTSEGQDAERDIW